MLLLFSCTTYDRRLRSYESYRCSCRHLYSSDVSCFLLFFAVLAHLLEGDQSVPLPPNYATMAEREEEYGLVEAGLRSSLATINVICQNYGGQVNSIPETEASALRSTLDSIVTKARTLRESLEDNEPEHEGHTTDHPAERTLTADMTYNCSMEHVPIEDNYGDLWHEDNEGSTEGAEQQPLQENDEGEIPAPSSNSTSPLVVDDSSGGPENKEVSVHFAPPPPPPMDNKHQVHGDYSDQSPPSDSNQGLDTALVPVAVSSALPHQPRGRIDALRNKAERLGATVIRAAANAATTVAQVLPTTASEEDRNGDPLLSGSSSSTGDDNWIEAARDAFRIIDVNCDGYLQRDEVIRAITMMQEDNSGMDFFEGDDPTEMADKMMAEVDIDGDGQIDMDEFVEMMGKGQAEKGGDNDGGGGLAFSSNSRMSQLARNVLVAHQKKVENSVIGNDMWMIHPMSNIHAIWDIVVSLLILLTVITMPLSIGWDEVNDAFFAMNLTVDFIFLFDVCKNFCTGFIDENDAVIMDAKIVRRNYVMGFFITDLCSSMPLDLILRAAGASGNSAVTGTKQSLKMLKLLRMAKLFRLLRISRLFKHIREVSLYLEEKLNFRISHGFTKLLRLGIGALVLGHWIGCFNFMLVRLNDFPEDSWVVYAGLDDKDAYTQWSWSFFKALAQMIMIGFETPPFTNASCDTASHWCSIEHWITLMCLYLGAVFYSLLISSISTVLQTASLASRQFEEKLTMIDDYMRTKKLPATMREKVKDYFHLQHAHGKLYDEAEILDMVTPILRREIKQFNGRDITTKVPIFNSVANKDFAEEMTTAIQPTIAFNDEVIMREKTTGDAMYFINSGVVEIFVAGAKKNAADRYTVAIGDGCVSQVYLVGLEG
mmetsp:Transcript_38350/g.83312  ORF Transcript_38350/g.83312 Transcript_38350/m.83312 type:complete len:883 (-) Transcript_38350:316-2964(-)